MAVVAVDALLVVIVSVTTFTAVSARVIEPSCEAPAVREGEVATVTCDFGVDLNDTHLWTSWGLELSPASGGPVRDIVEQFSPSFESPEIIVSAGYSYDGRLDRTVVVTIPKASPNHTGNYYCQIIAAQGASLSVQAPRQCVFILKGLSTTLPDTSVGPDPHTSEHPDLVTATASSEEAAGNTTVETDDEQSEDNNAGIIVGLLITCIVVVIVVVVVVVKVVVPWIKRRQEQNTTLGPLLDSSTAVGSERDVEGARPLLLHSARTQGTASSHGSTSDIVTVEETAQGSSVDGANAQRPAADGANEQGSSVDDANTLRPAANDVNVQGSSVDDASSQRPAADDGNAQEPAVNDPSTQGFAVDDEKAQGSTTDDTNAQKSNGDDTTSQNAFGDDAGSETDVSNNTKTEPGYTAVFSDTFSEAARQLLRLGWQLVSGTDDQDP